MPRIYLTKAEKQLPYEEKQQLIVKKKAHRAAKERQRDHNRRNDPDPVAATAYKRKRNQQYRDHRSRSITLPKSNGTVTANNLTDVHGNHGKYIDNITDFGCKVVGMISKNHEVYLKTMSGSSFNDNDNNRNGNNHNKDDTLSEGEIVEDRRQQCRDWRSRSITRSITLPKVDGTVTADKLTDVHGKVLDKIADLGCMIAESHSDYMKIMSRSSFNVNNFNRMIDVAGNIAESHADYMKIMSGSSFNDNIQNEEDTLSEGEIVEDRRDDDDDINNLNRLIDVAGKISESHADYLKIMSGSSFNDNNRNDINHNEDDTLSEGEIVEDRHVDDDAINGRDSTEDRRRDDETDPRITRRDDETDDEEEATGYYGSAEQRMEGDIEYLRLQLEQSRAQARDQAQQLEQARAKIRAAEDQADYYGQQLVRARAEIRAAEDRADHYRDLYLQSPAAKRRRTE